MDADGNIMLDMLTQMASIPLGNQDCYFRGFYFCMVLTRDIKFVIVLQFFVLGGHGSVLILQNQQIKQYWYMCTCLNQQTAACSRGDYTNNTLENVRFVGYNHPRLMETMRKPENWVTTCKQSLNIHLISEVNSSRVMKTTTAYLHICTL